MHTCIGNKPRANKDTALSKTRSTVVYVAASKTFTMPHQSSVHVVLVNVALSETCSASAVPWESQQGARATLEWPSMVMAMSMTRPFRAPCTSPTTEAADLELPTSISTSK